VAQRSPDGRWIRLLTVVDQFTRECLVLHVEKPKIPTTFDSDKRVGSNRKNSSYEWLRKGGRSKSVKAYA